MNTEQQSNDKSFFGHPRGLATLFFTEIWERFSYYGMRALLVLFMTAPLATGGLAYSAEKAGIIYGLYTSLVYMLSVPGGWIADRILGQRKSVLIGGIIIALGHFSMAIHSVEFFYLGLLLIIIGTGLLKPNISTMVGGLYQKEDVRRDAGFSIFYMGINIGAMISPIVCGYLGQNIDWHLGFTAAGFGMVLGVVQYIFGGKHLHNVGLRSESHTTFSTLFKQNPKFKTGTIITIGLFLIIAILQFLNIISITIETLSIAVGVILLVLPIAYITQMLTLGGFETAEKKRISVVFILFIFSALFWSAFEQAGSSLNLFADRLSNNVIFGIEFPSSWYQAINSIFIISLAPVIGWIWIKLKKHEPSSPTKFSFGLIFVGLGFAAIAFAATFATPEARVNPMWLVLVYLLHTIGELCLSPVGLSMVTKLSPQRVVAQMMGVWFLSLSVGNYIGGQVASLFEKLPLPQLFGAVFAVTGIAGVLLIVLTKPIKNLMGGVK